MTKSLVEKIKAHFVADVSDNADWGINRGLRTAIDVIELHEAEEQSGWQPIETAPRGRIVLMFAYHADGDNLKMATGCHHYAEDVFDWDGQRLDKPYHLKPTHWMPLPKPPGAA